MKNNPAMITFESVEDALAFAVSKEASAHDFYSDLAERTTDEVSRKLFTELAAEEMEHKEKIELEIIKRGRVVPLPPSDKRPTVISVQAVDEIPADLAYPEALMLAMRKEEASFRLYVGLLPFVADSETYEVLISLAEEEARHKMLFEQILNARSTRYR